MDIRVQLVISSLASTIKFQTNRKKLDKIIGFYWHLAVYVIINLFLIILIGTNTDEGFWNFGTFATAFFWGIGLAFHFLGV